MNLPEHTEDEEPGTRFLLYPQSPFLEPDAPLELVEVSAPQGSLGARAVRAAYVYS